MLRLVVTTLPAGRTRSLAGSVLVSAMAAAVLLAVGCAGSPREGGFDSAVPAGRIEAIDALVDDWRRSPPATRSLSRQDRINLVECLRSDDDLVRLFAIEALAEMTGERRGYRHDALPAARYAAIEAWVPWVEEAMP